MSRDSRSRILPVVGPMPKHEWDGTKIRFQKSGGDWGDWVDVRGPESINKVFVKEEISHDEVVKELLVKIKAPRNGLDGTDGRDGKDGADGKDGLSIYEVWLGAGNIGTEQDFFDWIVSEIKEALALEEKEKPGAGPLRLKLDMLVDVDVRGATNGQVLVYRASDNKWVPGAGGSGGNAEWGDIGGNISAQTDLQNALNAKANSADLGTMAGESASDYSPTADFDDVAFSGDYADLSGTPDLSGFAPLESPVFTGTVGLPAGQDVNGVVLEAGGGGNEFLADDGSYKAVSTGFTQAQILTRGLGA